MTIRTIQAYVAMFLCIEETIVHLNAESFMCDYEAALHAAIRRVYKCSPHGCYFHYTQAVRRKAAQIQNFFGQINRNYGMSRVYHQYLALPLLPKSKIMEGVLHLKNSAMAFGDVFTAFVSYHHKE